jgi:RimJ/RimL family protein N-acetyltransferase
MTNTKRLPRRLKDGNIELIKISPKNDNVLLAELLGVYTKNRKHLLLWHHGWKELLFENIKDIKNHLKRNRLSCYVLRYFGKIIGSIEIGRLSNDDENLKSRVLAYWIDKAHTWKGIMYNALRMMEKMLFAQKLDFIKTEVDVDNEPSIALMEKLNYKIFAFAFQISKNGKTMRHFEAFIKMCEK